MRDLQSSLRKLDLSKALPEQKVELYQLLARRKLLQSQQELGDLASFVRLAWPILEPATPLAWNWHLDLICEYLTLVQERMIRRLILNVPPQTMKSRLVNVFYPCWTWATIPSRRFLSSSYSGDLSVDFSVERRKLLSSAWFQQTWPGKVDFAPDQNQKAQFENIVGGRMTATSTGGTATGKGAHDVIVDDPQNPKEAESEAERKSATDFFDGTLRTRLSDQVSGAFIVVMQRLHEQDLTGHLVAKEPGAWTHVRIPMEADADERWTFPISGRVVERKKGELLWTDRFPREVVDGLRRGLGSLRYAGQYQQRPSVLEGNILKRGWWKLVDSLPDRFEDVIQIWDTAFEPKEENDPSVCLTLGVLRGDFFLIDLFRDRLIYPDLLRKARELYAKHRPRLIVIEKKASGHSLIQSLQGETGIPLLAMPADGSKTVRAASVSGIVEGGRCHAPRYAPWLEGFIEECAAFNKGAHDDQVDVIVHGLRYYMLRPDLADQQVVMHGENVQISPELDELEQLV